jgi:hypothetical protein
MSATVQIARCHRILGKGPFIREGAATQRWSRRGGGAGIA